jgi:hypothetical protein
MACVLDLSGLMMDGGKLSRVRKVYFKLIYGYCYYGFI